MVLVGEALAVGRAEATLDAHAADVEMLRRAIARIRGDARPFVAEKARAKGAIMTSRSSGTSTSRRPVPGRSSMR